MTELIIGNQKIDISNYKDLFEALSDMKIKRTDGDDINLFLPSTVMFFETRFYFDVVHLEMQNIYTSKDDEQKRTARCKIKPI